MLEVLLTFRSFDVQKINNSFCSEFNSTNMATVRNSFLTVELTSAVPALSKGRYPKLPNLHITLPYFVVPHVRRGLSGSLFRWSFPTKVLERIYGTLHSFYMPPLFHSLDIMDLIIQDDEVCASWSFSFCFSFHPDRTNARVSALSSAPCFQKHPVLWFRSSGMLMLFQVVNIYRRFGALWCLWNTGNCSAFDV
jgi:hypothetical protein